MDEQDPVTERAKQRVGATLKEKWRLDGLIGVGGMAAVYSATHRNGNRVAVKMLHAELSVDPEVRTRFLREGKVANKVDHPGAVVVQDDETAEDGAVFLVMELLEGETLAHRFERKGRSLVIEEVLLIADQVLDVLAVAHDQQIVHRDIKPDNIFLTRTGGVKVLDFGIARLRELSTQTNATRSGSTMGTPAYMAPEQARARWDEVDGRTDLWAVGATMFKLLTGRVVHVADTINEQLLAAMTLPAPPIASLVPTVPIPVLEVVDKALAFNKADRWRDARSMQQAIRDAYQAIAGVSPASVRLSFGDLSSGADAHADTIAVSSKVPTSLSVARDSSPRARPSRTLRKVFWLVALGSLGAAGYFVVRNGQVPPLPLLRSALDAGSSLASGAVGLGSSEVLPSGAAAIAPAPAESGAAVADGLESGAAPILPAPELSAVLPPAVQAAAAPSVIPAIASPRALSPSGETTKSSSLHKPAPPPTPKKKSTTTHKRRRP